MKKYILDLEVCSVERQNERYVLIKLTDDKPLPEMLPGQFVEIQIEHSPATFLRRPISINYVDVAANQLWLLVAAIGEGTRHLAQVQVGQKLNCVLPLGRGFTLPSAADQRSLLIGGGVGVAPLLYLGSELRRRSVKPVFLLGSRTAADQLELDLFRSVGDVCLTTEDGSLGEKGFVTNHPILQQPFDMIYTCGPKPMMMAVARYAEKANVDCEASLENLMACGLGACLCCVEKTTEGNLCVCKEGPVFSTKRLLWNS